MIYLLQPEDLKVGMYVILPVGKSDPALLRNQFLITSEKELEEIRKSLLKMVQVDSAKSQASRDFQTITHPAGQLKKKEKPHEVSYRQAPAEWNPEKLMTHDLRAAIHDEKLPPAQKAQAVYRQSIKIFDNVFEHPTAKMIRESKGAIAEITDLILRDEETGKNLLRLTSHDFYTYTHSVNVGILGTFLAKRLYGERKDHNLPELSAAFFLHDLGKIRVPPEILNKPARLTAPEMKRMRIHPYQSYKILEETGNLSGECGVICMQHHEREDGTGYPRRLQGDEIHDYARICSIADVFDALTAERAYKRSLSPYQALTVMKEEMLGFFHKDIFENFVRLFETQ